MPPHVEYGGIYHLPNIISSTARNITGRRKSIPHIIACFLSLRPMLLMHIYIDTSISRVINWLMSLATIISL